MVKPPLPFMVLASINNTSPPDGVQARPTTTPDRFVRSAISPSLRTLIPPRNSWTTSLVTISLSVLPSARRRACFTRVVPDDVAHAFFRKFNLLGGHTVLFNLPRNQVLKRDVDFFFFRVTL